MFRSRMPWTMANLWPTVIQTRFAEEAFVLEFPRFRIRINKAQQDFGFEYGFSPKRGSNEKISSQDLEKFIAKRRIGKPLPPVLFPRLESLDDFLMSCYQEIDGAFSNCNAEDVQRDLRL